MTIKTAVGYLRVSSEDQICNFSLENQADFIKRYCKDNNFELVELFTDAGRSGQTIEGRNGLLTLLDFCRKNKGSIDAVIAYRLDRFSRNTLDFLTVKQSLASYGVKILSCSEPISGSDPTSEFLETLLAAIAKMDNQIRRLRAVQGLQKRLESGLNVTQPPLAYKMVKDMSGRSVPIPKEPEFSLLRKAGLLYMTGNYSMKMISDLLNEWNVKTMYGHTMTGNSTGKFLKCEFYKGTLFLRRTGKRYKGNYQIMFSEDEWQRIQYVASNKPLGAKKTSRLAEFPLRRFIRCGVTGEYMTGSHCKGKNSKFAYYYNPRKFKSVRREKLEDAFIELLNNLEPVSGVLETFSQVLYQKYKETYQQLEQTETHFDNQLVTENMYKVKLVEDRLKDNVDSKKFIQELEKVQDHITVDLLSKNEATIDKVTIDTTRNFCQHYLCHLGQFWRTHEIDDKRRLQWLLFPEGLIWDYGKFKTPKISSLFELNPEFANSSISIGEACRSRTPPWKLYSLGCKWNKWDTEKVGCSVLFSGTRY